MGLGAKILIRVITLIIVMIAIIVGIFVVGIDQLTNELFDKQASAAKNSIQSAIEAYQEEALHKAQMIAGNEEVVEAVLSGDPETLRNKLVMLSDGLDLITLCNPDGIVLARSHNDKLGDDVSNQEALTIALKTGTGIKTIEPGSVIGVSTRGSAAIRDQEGNIIGALTCGHDLSKPMYVDMIKEQSNCEVTIFAGDERMNTTLIDENGERVIGTKANDNVVETVINDREEYTGRINLFGTLYQVTYAPLVVGDTVIGMLFAGVDIESTLESRNVLLKFIVIAAAVIMVLSMIIIFQTVNRLIAKPLGVFTAMSNQLAAGELNMEAGKLVDRKDEIGKLAKNFIKVVEALKTLKAEMDQIQSWAVLGKLSERAKDNDQVLGAYREIVHSANRMADVLVNHIDQIPIPMAFVNQDYNVLFMNQAGQSATRLDLAQAQSKKCHECLHADVCNTDRCPGRQAMQLGKMQIAEITAGDMELQVYAMPFRDEDNKVAGFLEIMVDQTEIKSAQRESKRRAEVTAQQMEVAKKQAEYQTGEVEKLIEALEELAKGNLNIAVEQTAYDEETKEIYENFHKIGSSLEGSCANIRSYINELAQVLARMSSKDLNVSIDREYMGDFAELKISINNITDTFNQVFAEISESATQVQSGSNQVANSAQSLAQGASEQASAVEQITSTIIEVTEQTKSNAQNANRANEISIDTKKDAEVGNQQMDEMVAAMETIRESSKGIANVIKVIEDIAFQTNILALNAAVEAARAGDHGKGFAVVAEEVRSLAAKSATAAKETTEMIDNSLQEVEAGARIAQQTAAALGKIVEGVTGTVKIVATIAQASSQQEAAIVQIETGMEQIAKVTQSSTAASEESAATSEEMAGQAHALQSMLNEFSLKTKGQPLRLSPPKSS